MRGLPPCRTVRAMRRVGVVLVAFLALNACGDGGPSDAERDAQLQATARTKVTPERCLDVVAEQAKSSIEVDSPFYADSFTCRAAGYDPVWEAYGVRVTDEDYARFAQTGSATRPTTTTREHICGGGVLVEYFIDGTAVSASITTQTPTGTSQQANVDVPLTTTSGGRGLRACFDHGEFVYISAQNDGSTGNLQCRIDVEGVTISSNTSSGAYSIATCDGSA